MIVEAGKNNPAQSAVWVDVAQVWRLKWRATTLKKTVNYSIAEQRALDVLGAVGCAVK